MKTSNKIFIIADTHFRHTKLITNNVRPAEYEEMIIQNWNNLVSPDDIVIHLGDVIWVNRNDLNEILGKLNGRKILVRGNHDTKSVLWYMKNGFEFVADRYDIVYNGVYCVFSHKPLKVEDYQINIHGHLHNHRVNEFEDYNHHLISLEDNGYTVTNLDDIIKNKYLLIDRYKAYKEINAKQDEIIFRSIEEDEEEKEVEAVGQYN